MPMKDVHLACFRSRNVGAFVSYAREFLGEKGAYVTGAPVGETTAGFHNVTDNGGFFPEGLPVVFALTLGLFALVVALMVAGWYAVRGRIRSDLLDDVVDAS